MQQAIRNRDKWKPSKQWRTVRQNGKTQELALREWHRLGTRYRLVESVDITPRKGNPHHVDMRWHLYGPSGEIHEVQPYTRLDAAIAQAEAWLKENGLID